MTTEQGTCPSEAEMAYEELIAQLQRENRALYEALEAMLEAQNQPAAYRERVGLEARAALAAARGDA